LSEPLRILVVFGTRPEAIKMAPVVLALKARPSVFSVRTCAMARDRGVLDQALKLFSITPDIDLDLTRPGQTLSDLGARVLSSMDKVLVIERPDWVLVQGDTTTVAMTALAAQHRQVRVGHVEAGLRTGDRSHSFPEEMNRILTDHISDLCFAPTETARANLLHEGISESLIRVTGNTVVDALFMILKSTTPKDPDALLETLRPDRQWILVTAHRRESFGQPLGNVCSALRRIVEERGDQVHVVYPVRRNPAVWEPVRNMLGSTPGITLLPPVDYGTLLSLIERCALVLTDSGGLQEQAPSLNKPVLVLREKTECPEAEAVGATRVVGTDPARIVSETFRLLDDPEYYERMARAPNPYGDGYAAERITETLLELV
jgi:UDP-N-acetylglucosamine 2-epimerase (non-hydrolysing)